MNIKSDSLCSRFLSAKICRFHNAWPTARCYHETPSARGNLNGPLAKEKREPPGIFVIARHIQSSLGALVTEFRVLFQSFYGSTKFTQIRLRLRAAMKTS